MTIMGYGHQELLYAKPFADALVERQDFKTWVLQRTEFAKYASKAHLLHKEMWAIRNADYWWRSHYTEVCRCQGCSGQETDLLAVFEAASGVRFALHVEVKHPTDKFKNGGTQAAAYPHRARCWATEGRTPRNVLYHSEATTALLFSERKKAEYAPHLKHFAALMTFELIHKDFPDLGYKRLLNQPA